MRIIFLTAYYPPERGAPQTRLHETARGLLARGHAVRVVTGPPHYPDGAVRPGYRAWRPTRELIDDVPVTRLPMLPRPNGGLLDRLVDQGSFAAAALAAVPEIRWSDVFVVESPPLTLGPAAAWLRLAGGRPYLFHVADPWPDFPIAMGALEQPLLRRAAYALEALAYRRAALVTTVTPGLVELLAAKPAAGDRVRLLPNGVDTRRFEPDRDPAQARRRLGWPEARLTLVYAGSVGRAQGLTTLLEAVAPLEGGDLEEGIIVHVVGEGFERDRLAAEAARRGLTALRFEPPVAAARVPEVLAAADGVLVLLRRGPLYDHALPTKLVEGLAAGRPLIVSADGEAAAIAGEAGLSSPAEDAAALRAAIVDLAGRQPEARATMGRAARALAETTYDRTAIVERLEGYLEAIREPSRSR